MNASQINWDSGNDHSHSNAIVILHRLMRGKYLLTLVFALVFGITGGAIGYLSQSPQYRSTGVIRIQPSLPKVLYESEQSTAPKMFSSFVNSQAQFITYGQVVKLAIESDSVKALQVEIGYQFDVDEVRRKLSAKPDRRGRSSRPERSGPEPLARSAADHPLERRTPPLAGPNGAQPLGLPRRGHDTESSGQREEA